MNHFSIVIIFSLCCIQLNFGQVGIGNTNPKATLDITASNSATPSSTDGILIPRIDAFPLTNPGADQNGMLVFLTTDNKFYYWNQGSTNWLPMGGTNEWDDLGPYLTPLDGITKDVNIGGNYSGAKLSVNSDKSLAIGVHNNTVQNTLLNGLDINLTNNSTSNSSFTIGTRNSISNQGAGLTYGVGNYMTGAETSIVTGNYSYINGTSIGNQTGNAVVIENTGNGQHTGFSASLNGNGDGFHIGSALNLLGEGNGFKIGNDINVSSIGDGLHVGFRASLNGTGSGTHTGLSVSAIGSGSGLQIGSSHYIDISGHGEQKAVDNIINSIGNGDHYGISNVLRGVGTGLKYGSYNNILSNAGGTHYGLYSEVLKPGSFAGYFLGNVSVGTSSFNTYTFPASRGTNEQIMQTDGSGGISWVSIPNQSDADWYEQIQGLPADDINDNIFTHGEVAIGNTLSTGGKLEVTDNSELRGIHVRKIGNYTSGSGVGILSEVSAVGTSFNVGFSASLSTSGTNTPQLGFSSNLSGSGLGKQTAFSGYIDTTNDYEQVGIDLLIQGIGLGPRYGAKIRLGGSIGQNGDQTGIDNRIINQGSGNHTGIINDLSGAGIGSSLFKKGMYNIIGGIGSVYGIEQIISGGGANTLPMYGYKTTLNSNLGSGIRTGIDTEISGTSTGPQTGIHSRISNSGNGNLTGFINAITGAGDGVLSGVTTNVSGIGNGDKYGAKIVVNASGNGLKVGTQNTITNGGIGTKIATNNIITAISESIHIGTSNSLTGISNGLQYGTLTTIDIDETSSADHFGSYTSLSGSGIGERYGSYISLLDNNGGNQFGTYTEISNSGGGFHYGQKIILSGTGLGTKYGVHVFKPTSSNGVGYGVYANVLNAGSYAGYFLGNVAIGTTTANTYTLPANRGINGQVMRIDGAGNVNWTNDSATGLLIDTNGDTQIQVEEIANEDKIRFDTNGVERMIIDANGLVGVNTSNPGDELHVKGAIRVESNVDTDYWFVNTDGSDDYNFYYNGILQSYIRDTDGMYVVFSDKRLKEDIRPVSEVISEKIMALNPVNYTYASDNSNTLQHGFIAQEVQQLFPELVEAKQTKNGEFLSLNYQAFSVLAIKMIQKQQDEINLLKNEISALNKLESRIIALENKN